MGQCFEFCPSARALAVCVRVCLWGGALPLASLLALTLWLYYVAAGRRAASHSDPSLSLLAPPFGGEEESVEERRAQVYVRGFSQRFVVNTITRESLACDRRETMEA